MATGQSENTSDEIFNFKCTPCLQVNKTKEAVKYCVECQGYCCQACVDTHAVFPTLRNHTLLDKSNMKTTTPTRDLPEVPTARCDRHETNLVNLYCGKHDVVGCTTCMGLEHRTCLDVQSIPECIDMLYQKSDVEKIYQMLHDKKLTMEKIKNIRQSLLQKLKESTIEAVNEINHFKREMVSILENLEKESINEAENESRRIESVFKEEERKAKTEMECVTAAVDDLQKSEGNKAQQFVSLKIAQATLTKAEDVSSSLGTPIDATITFTADRSIQEFLKHLKTFGSVRQNDTTALEPRTSVYTVKSTRTRDLNVKMQNDTLSCSVWGSCFTEDGLLLLADHDNKKLKRADIVRMSVVDYCDLQNNPYGVCCTDKQEAAVAFNTDYIQFVSLGNKMTPTRQMKLGHSSIGIAYRDNRLYASDNCNSLYIHDMSGNLLQTVTQDSSGKALFQCSRYITFSDKGDTVFAADWYKGVITVDSKGKDTSTISYSVLSGANGVCTDHRGNVFVCGYKSGNVLQITQKDNKNLGVVVKQSDGVGNPTSVSFDPRQCTLVVTNASSDVVKLFELQ